MEFHKFHFPFSIRHLIFDIGHHAKNHPIFTGGLTELTVVNDQYQISNDKWKMESDGHGGGNASAPGCPWRLPNSISISHSNPDLPLKSRSAPEPPRLHPCTAARPGASGGSFRRSKLPDISNTRRPSHRPTNSPRCATSGKSESSPVNPSPASARNSWRDPEISSPRESSRADWITCFQSLPTPAADISARNPQSNSSHKNPPGHISHQGSV